MQYEYFVKTIDTSKYSLDRELESFGKDGWELISVLRGRNNWDYELFFKRNIKP